MNKNKMKKSKRGLAIVFTSIVISMAIYIPLISEKVIFFHADGGTWSLLNLVLAVFTMIMMFTTIIRYIQKKSETNQNDTELAALVVCKQFGLGILSIAITLISGIIFILTSDMIHFMVFSDKYSLWMVLLFVVQIVISLSSAKSRRAGEVGEPQTVL